MHVCVCLCLCKAIMKREGVQQGTGEVGGKKEIGRRDIIIFNLKIRLKKTLNWELWCGDMNASGKGEGDK